MKKFLSVLPLLLVIASNASADWDCAPVTGPIPFSGSWVYTDGANFVAGELPQFGTTRGDLRVTTWDYNGEWNGRSYGGLVSFRASGFFPGSLPPYFAYPAGSGRPMGPFGRPGTVNIDGTIRLSARAKEQIREAIESGLLRIPGVDRSDIDLTKVCVSELGMNVGRQNAGFGGQIRGGNIYLYLNQTRARYEMRF